MSDEIRIIRSRRKTMSIEVRPEGVVVRVPRWVLRAEIDRFIAKNEDWIRAQRKKAEAAEQRLAGAIPLTEGGLALLTERAKEIIPERVAHYSPLLGVDYGRITIRHQRTRWGSCSAKGNLNFNCLLLLAPPEVLDSVVVHELCHRKHMDHSKAFYAEVRRVFPAYDRWNRWLKDNGRALLARVPG